MNAGWLNVLADKQLAAEQKQQDLLEQHDKNLNIAIDLLKQGDIEGAEGFMNEAKRCRDAERVEREAEDRYCDYCGCHLVPHSASWYEGRHIDGCDTDYKEDEYENRECF